MPDTITGRKEGTRFATDVSIYDPETGDIIASLAEVAAGGTEGPQGPEGPEGPQGPEGPAGADGADGFPTETQWNDLVARVAALEAAAE